MIDSKDTPSPIEVTSPIPSSPPLRRRRTLIAVITVVIVVVVAGSVSVVILVSNHSTSTPSLRVALIAGSVVNGLANQQLVMTYFNGSHSTGNESIGNYSWNVTEFETMLYSNASGTAPPAGTTSTGNSTFSIQSVEFSSPSGSLNYFDYSYQEAVQSYRAGNSSFINVHNTSYDHFIYSYLLINHSYTISNITNDYSLNIVGHSGSFAFVIFDLNVQLSSYTTLIDDEIQAMTS